MRDIVFMELSIFSKKYGAKTVLIDDEDYDLIKRIKWNIAHDDEDDVYYARGRVKKKDLGKYNQSYVRMHRIIMNAPRDKQVDHVNHNGLDNRKENLRLSDQKQNSANMRLAKDSTTGFKGVTYQKKKKLYKVRLRVNYKLIYGGMHKNIYKAALMYNELAKKHFGEFACLNQLTNEQIEEAKKEMPMRILSSNKTGYRGVCIRENTSDNIYVATLRIDGKNKNLGYFSTPEMAAKAYNEAVIKYGKPLTYLNKIPNE